MTIFSLNTFMPRPRRTAQARVRLLPRRDGWALMTADGRTLFRASGTDARRSCLSYAHDADIVALSS